MLAELMANGVKPDLVVGVSVGALNGAFLAYDPSPATVERMIDLWSRIRTRDILPVSIASLWGLIGRRGYLAHSHGIRRVLERELPYRGFDALHVPLYIVAADQLTGDEVLLSTGSVIDSVLASTAIPGVYPPVMLGGRVLVDGVVASGTPISVAVRLGAQRITIVPCGFACATAVPPRRAVARAMHAITLVGARQLKHDFAHYGQSSQLCVVPPLCPLQYSSYDYSHGAKLIAAARTTTRRWLDAGGLDRREFPNQLIEHTH